jgi:Family of unknown function (DUF6338)
MDLRADTIVIFVILLPGFVSSTILDSIATRRPKDTFAKIVEALIFSFIIYAITFGILGYPVISLPAETQKLPAALGSRVNARFVLGALILSVVLPLVLGWLTASDRHMKVLRWAGITHKTSRDTIWLDVFIEQKRYVIVNLTGQRRIFGWPMYYSEDSTSGLLYLQDPAWVKPDGTYDELNVHGIFLVEKGSIESIEFTNLDEHSAQTQGA